MTTANDNTKAAQPETRVPEIPTLRTDDPKLRSFVDAVRELLQVREGRLGNPLDANVTYRDLVVTGIAAPAADGTVVPGSGGAGSIGGGSVGSGGLPILLPPAPVCMTNFSTPPPPFGLTAVGAFTAILLTWNTDFECGAYTEIFRYTEDNLTAAQAIGPIGTTGSHMYTDTVGNARLYYYWVRTVSYTNITGPFNSINGTPGQTSSDPEYVLGVLSGQIGSSQLNAELGGRINILETKWLTYSGSDIGDLYDITGDLAEEIHTVQSSSVATRTFFQDTAPTNPTTGETPPYALKLGDVWYDTTAGKKLPSYRWDSTLHWVLFTPGVRVFWQDNPPISDPTTGQGPFATGDLWYDLNDNNKPYIWSGTAWVPHLDLYTRAYVIDLNRTQIGYATVVGTLVDATESPAVTYPTGVVFDNHGAILHSSDVDAWNSTHPTPATGQLLWHEGMPLATAVKQVGVSVGGTGVAMEQRFKTQAIDNTHFDAMYTLKIDNQGYVTGFGLSSENPNGTPWPKSLFEVRADSFALAPAAAPNWNTGTTYNKFQRVTYAVNGHVYESKVDGNRGNVPPTGAVPPAHNENAAWLDLSDYLPFIARTTSTVIDGVTYPPGVWMDSTFIVNASITSAQIKNVAAEIINTSTFLQAPKTASAKLYAEELYLGPADNFTFHTNPVSGLVDGVTWKGLQDNPDKQGIEALTVGGNFLMNIRATLQSPGFASGSHGWLLIANGDAELNNAIVRGTIYAGAGKIGGNDINAAFVRSGTFSATVPYAGWELNSNGSATFRNITITDANGVVAFATGAGLNWNAITGVPLTVQNSNITLGANGQLNNAGGGKVTLPGLGVNEYRVITNGFTNTNALPAAAGFYKNGAPVVFLASPTHTGYTVFAIRRSDDLLVVANTYPTYATPSTAGDLAALLNGLDSTYFVVVIGFDEPHDNRLSLGLDAAMYRCGASKHVFGSTDFKFRSAYVLVGIPGIGEGNGAESYSGYTDPATSMWRAWCDVGFSTQAGAILGVSGATTPQGLVSGGNPINTGNVSTFIAAGAIGDLYIGNFIQSSDFNGVISTGGVITNVGTKGWAIGKTAPSGDPDGAIAVFQNLTARGDITANNIVANTITVGMIQNDQITNTNAGIGTSGTGMSGLTAQCTVDDGGTGSAVLNAVCSGLASFGNAFESVYTKIESRPVGSLGAWTLVADYTTTVQGIPFGGGGGGYDSSGFAIPMMGLATEAGHRDYRVVCSATLTKMVAIVGTGMKR